jgi:hypothetical protein
MAVLVPPENASETSLPETVSRTATETRAQTETRTSTEPPAPTQSGVAYRDSRPDVASMPESRSPSRDLPDRREDTVTERTVDEGDRFRVALTGSGWIYLGGGGALQFLDRTTEGEQVVFTFRVPSTAADGDVADDEPAAVLEFEMQDLATGRRTRHEERILVADQDGDGGSDSANVVDSPMETTATGSVATEEQSAAGAMVGPTEEASAEDLFRHVDELEASAEYEAAVAVLESMRRDATGRQDVVTFRMAEVYEAEWEGRDLLLARNLYRSVIENYPLSRWRRQARERIEYLNRHFFHIR